ncbi:MAG: hypothetical protein ABSC72_04440 [Methylovirgula sp.]|jgi:hypothetical protein
MSKIAAQILVYGSEVLILLVYVLLVGQIFLNRNLPRVGGKIGPPRVRWPVSLTPPGFSYVDCRAITLFSRPPDAMPYADFKTYLRDAPLRHQALVRVYLVALCNTRIEIMDRPTYYQRIDAVEALALLRELPDLRLVYRLQLSDEPSFLDPWACKVAGKEVFLLGNATTSGLIVLYLPDRRLGQMLGLTLLHEWLHLLAFNSAGTVRRFNRADAIEPLREPALAPVSFGDPKAPFDEAWTDLGENLLGYDGTAARRAALAAPAHAMILWQRVEKSLRKTPLRLRSTRFAEFVALGHFMRQEVAPKARALRARMAQSRH